MPTTLRPFSARDSATSSPPTPMPRTMASTCSAISPGVAGRGSSSRRHGLLQRLIESQGLPLRPNFLGVLRAQSFAPGATLLLAQELPDAGSGRPLMHPGRARQPRRRPRIPVGSNNLREIVKLQDHAGNVSALLEELDGFKKVLASGLDVPHLERHETVGMEGPAEAEPIVDCSEDGVGFFERYFGRCVLTVEVVTIAESPERPPDARLVTELSEQR